ncbi:VOC family protein [Parasphingorhabdus sp. DH2-15]|uniref:VOC family protein n=1 Tax=Parasphingorhabdus sp. DH2-15 TaxID=3444112 RepID=UPI003F682EF0
MSGLRPFHLAFPVHDIDAARAFYVNILGCSEGRSSSSWIDLDLYGHQIVAHLDPLRDARKRADTNQVDGDAVPIFHFGVILQRSDWEALAEHLQTLGINFLIAPRIRFEGQAGEQGTFFLTDPSGNGLEFKCFADDAQIFATD